ncbi:cyclin-dependent kinase G-2 [Dorcoceras hygrometricum]|uniref:cyclin-dependent kinase n=1 Tax=Dorcoceras hygrometricum TaxID=472368 RepID=A0A2Z7C0C1_9LAMI|nr:cyclin-dependent kinase G-2 [Dorcoceras hygrometricum]
MAAGRHGGYRENEFRNREGDFGLSRKEIGYSEGGYEGNVGRDGEKGKVRNRDILENRGRIRQKDIREREVMNGEYHSTSSRSDSGGGGPRKCGYAGHSMDREPGELSDGSDEAIDSEIQANKETEIKKLVNGNQLSPLQTKKRKFSPIVWDRDDAAIKTRNISETINLPPPPPLSKPEHQLPAIDQMFDVNLQTEAEDEKESNVPQASSMELLPDLSDLSAETSLQRPEEYLFNNQGIEAVDGDEDVPSRRTIKSSRWANDLDSPVDEGEISDHEVVRQSSRNSLSESTERRIQKSLSPELGEVKREGSEGPRTRSFGSEERVRTSSRESNHETDEKNDHMEVDDGRNYDATSVSQSDMESEDDHDSRGTPEPANPPQRSFNMLQGCRNVDEFERLNKIDEGTYGVVFRARDKKTGEVVALKKVKMEKEREGFPLTSLREINILLSFHHPFIVDVKEVVVGSNLDSIFMVMEYMEHDLKGLMETIKQPFSQSEVKCLMLQLLGGVKYLHDNWVLHRDLKTSNLLMNNRGELKICDFGLARQYGSPLKPYTSLVVTLWYRAPELLLGAKQYSTAIDMWSLGCIMAELLSKEPLFNGKTEVEQLDKIFKILGTPNETIWPGFSKLPGVKVNFVKHKLPALGDSGLAFLPPLVTVSDIWLRNLVASNHRLVYFRYNLLRKKFPATSFTGSPVLSDAGFDLLNKLLTYDPDKRITAEDALNHPWFREVPLPKSKEFMPTFPAQHAQDRRMRRVMKSPDPLEEQRRKELQQGEFGTGGLFGQ